MEGVTLVTMAFTLEGDVKSVGAMKVAQQILNVTLMEIANVRTAPVAKSATIAIGTSLTSHRRDVSLVIVMKEGLLHCSATKAQVSALARQMLKATSARNARMEHTIVTLTILMDVPLVSVMDDQVAAPLRKVSSDLT